MDLKTLRNFLNSPELPEDAEVILIDDDNQGVMLLTAGVHDHGNNKIVLCAIHTGNLAIVDVAGMGTADKMRLN